jgi:Cft2 family RNA processing exonuclease
VDCGPFQGGKKSEALNRPPTAPNRKLDAALLTHGHLDLIADACRYSVAAAFHGCVKS